ncbi:MAG: M43 family zinc metalloprotease [Sediminibacterium sp.]
MWPSDQYLNIWVVRCIKEQDVDINCANISGYAYLPPAPSNVDGIVAVHHYIGTTGTAVGNELNTLSHEAGHYLSLLHVWGYDGFFSPPYSTCHANNECLVKGDFVCDTPPASGPLYTSGSCPSPVPNDCSLDVPDLPYPVENYMSYANECQTRFTEGQAARMHFALENYRLNLWSISNLIGTGAGESNGADITINANTTWSWATQPNGKIVAGNITIKSGSTLNIECILLMSINKKIVIEKGAKLLVNGGRISTYSPKCVGFWTGIEVNGDPTKSQTIANQGTLELKNGAFIDHANNAIVTGTNGITTQGGGIIKADNTTFQNNRRAVEFLRYNIADNESYFNNCTFELRSYYPQTTYVGMVTIWDNYGIPFTNCTFRNLSASLADKKYGIYTIDAGYQVLSGSNFNGFVGGVYGTNSSTSRTFSVSGSTFRNSALGVYAGSVNNISATGNAFNVGQYSTGSYNYGVYLSASSGYTVQNNSFTGYNPTATPGPAGVFCLNTGDANNVVRENSYTNLYAGNYAVGDNRNNSIPANGLKFLCNLNNANAAYDFLVVNYTDPNVSGIATPQGSSLAAAGNTFSLRSSPTGSDYRNNTNYSIQYYYQNVVGENPMNTTGVVKTLTSNGSGCTSFIMGGGSLSSSELASLQNGYNTQKSKYDTELQTRNSKLDNGNTNALSTEIDKVQRGSSTALEEKLMGISPWLSTEVLKQVLDKKEVFTSDFAVKLLKANPEALFSPSLQRTMEQVLSVEQLNTVRAAQNTSTERSALESRLAEAGNQWSWRADAILRHYLITAPIDLKKVREWLDKKNDLESSYQIVESWLQEKNTAQAKKSLNNIAAQFKLTAWQQSVYEDYQKITDLKIKAMDQGRTIADFNETEVAALVALADRNLGRAGEQARGILNFFYGYNYVAAPLSLSDDAVAQRSQRLLPESNVMSAQVTSLIQVVPNPASSEVTFKYNLNEQQMQEAFIQVVDFTGKVIQRFEINENMGEIHWNMNHLQNGIYFYSMRNNGKVISFGRLVVAK